MSRNLPSPVALRSFEAAARNLSFTRAARELYVTQSAVSHQVRALEEELGVRLFLRLTRQLKLTDAGETLLTVVRHAYDRIEETVQEIKAGSGAFPLRVSLTSYMAARWFTRRLDRFCARHPEIEIHLLLSNTEVNIRRTDLDISIMWGYGEWTDVESIQLMPIRLIAVCSPTLLRDGPPLNQVSDLKHYPLLHESGRGLWKSYLQAVGSASTQSKRNIVMDDPNVLHQACIEGQGISLGAEALLTGELHLGQLVRPFTASVELGGYYIVCQPGARSRPNVSAFYEWLLDETKL